MTFRPREYQEAKGEIVMAIEAFELQGIFGGIQSGTVTELSTGFDA